MIYFAGMLGDWLSSSVGNGVPGILDIGIRSLAFSIATFIYQLIISFYNIFEKLCSGRFFDSELLKSFSERVGVVLGVVMLFIAIFSMIKMVVDPDKITDKEMGATSLIKKIIIVIVMLGVSNFAFSFLYKVQDIVLEEDIISKILLPIRIDESNSTSFGNVLSQELFMSFYKMEDKKNIVDPGENVSRCEGIIREFKGQIITSNNFNLGRECLSESVKVQSGGETIETFLITYNWLLSLIAGTVVAYLIFSYCISIGIRMIQLLFLEIISPMAIISYLIPKKDTMFGKWGKIYISTYIDVFIRVVIIDFIVFIIAAIFSSEFSFSFIESAESGERGLMVVIIIIALLTFAKKAPDLLKGLFPESDSKLGFGINSPKKILDGMLGGNVIRTGAKVATVGTAIGLGGAIMSGVSRYRVNMKSVDKASKDSDDPEERKAYALARKKALLGAAGGSFMALGRGLKSGAVAKGNVFKTAGDGFKAQRTIDDKYDQLITSGGDSPGAFGAKLSSFFGETKGQTFTRQIGYMDTMKKFKDDIESAADSFAFVRSAKSLFDSVQQKPGESNEDFNERKSELYKRYKGIREAAINAALNGENSYTYNGETFDILDNDQPNVTRIQTQQKSAKKFVESHAVEYWDKRSQRYVKASDSMYSSFATAKDFVKVATIAEETNLHIIDDDKYNAAIANDKAAGVDSSATANKK